MRILLGLVMALFLAWGGYWFVGSTAMERAAAEWFKVQTAEGLVAEHGAIAVHGFPSRFDLTVDDPHVADPATGFGWTAPFVQILSLSYAPWHVIAALPHTQQVATPMGELTLNSAKLQGSLVVTPSPDLALDRTRIVGDDLSLVFPERWTAAAKTLRFATERIEPSGLVHEIGLEVLEIIPDPAVHAAAPDLPGTIERLHVDAQLRLSAPLDRHAAETRPHVTGVDLKDLQLTWGTLGLFGKGSVAPDAGGRAEGRIDFRVTNWRAAMPLAVAAGVVKPEVRQTWENVLAALASQSGDPSNLDLPLTFRNGRTSLGPLPLGPAPLLK